MVVVVEEGKGGVEGEVMKPSTNKLHISGDARKVC